MSDALEFDYEELQVSLSYDPSSAKVTRRVCDNGSEVYHDELQFDKSLVAEFDLMSAEEQAKIATAWGAVGIKTKIGQGRIIAKKK